MTDTKDNILNSVLLRYGITDADAYLDQTEETLKIGKAKDPDVWLRGSIQLMKGRKSTRAEVTAGLDKLKYL